MEDKNSKNRKNLKLKKIKTKYYLNVCIKI